MKRIIYAYDTPTYRKLGWLKVGDTERDALTRISEQITASNPEQLILRGEWEIDYKYRDYEIHKILETNLGIKRIYKPADNVGVEEEDDGSIPFLKGKKGTEWFICSPENVAKAINILNFGIARPDAFPLREEQEEFVKKSFNYFTNEGKEFLGNAKCRFGKTFATYCLMKKLKSKITLILTYKPSVGGEWSSNLNSHIYFEKYKFYHALDFDKNNPIKIDGEDVVLFASFQDILGKEFDGKVKTKWKNITNFLNKYGIDLLVIDEAHFGADKKRAIEFTNSLKYKCRLDLSGTPLDLLIRGDYTDENTYTWSYIDEQKKRRKEIIEGKTEIYKWLPELHLYTYELGDEIIKDSDAYTEEEGLRLNKFFASDDGESFKNSSAVERWLNLLSAEDERFWCSPFNNNNLSGKLNHTFWILPSVNSCKAMRRLMGKHPYFRLFRVITASDDNDGEGRNTVELVKSSIRDNHKTITLSCGKLNTGITIKPWTAVFQLNDTESPETYWQTNFRPQSECKEIGKLDCFVFDFNPNRTLKMIYRYCEITARKNKSTPESIREFLETIKVLSYNGNMLVPMSNDSLEKIIESVIDIGEECKKFDKERMISTNCVDDNVIKSLIEILGTSGSITTIEISDSDLKSGKSFINRGGKKKGKKNDPEKILIEKGITILKSLPTFIFMADKEYESLTNVLNTTESDLFKIATTISLDEFKHMVDCGFFVGERLDRAIQALYLGTEKQCMSNFIIKTLKDRQRQISHLYSPSNVEVYTPLPQVKEQCNCFPVEIWSNYTLKFVDPACKSGIYLSEVVIRLMDGLKEWEPNEYKRYDHIIKNMVFGYAYTELGYRITKKLLYGDSNYNCTNIKLKWFNEEDNLDMEFDVILGNSPYNNDKSNGENPNGSSLWPSFVEKSLSLLKTGGYMSLVHPCSWRKPCDLWNIMSKENQIHYLEIHGPHDGQKLFKCGIRYDWYILEKTPSYKETIVIDEKREKHIINLKNYSWLPNFFVKSFSNLFSLDGKNCEIIRSTDYRTDKPWVSHEKTDVFKYPVAVKVKGGNQVFCYSSKKLSHFGVSKVICNSTGGENLYPLNDFDGKYGMNPHCFGISIKTKEEGNEIVKIFNTEKFKEFVSSIMWSGYFINHKAFLSLKKSFWKEFV